MRLREIKEESHDRSMIINRGRRYIRLARSWLGNEKGMGMEDTFKDIDE